MSTLKRPEPPELVDGIEPLPAYVAEEDGQGSIQTLLSGLLQSTDGGPALDANIVKELIQAEHQRRSNTQRPDQYGWYSRYHSETDELAYLADAVNRALFEAIAKGQSEYIALLLDNGLITANTKDRDGKSPLLAAVEAQRVRIVQELVDFDAEPDAYAVTGLRTTSRGQVQIMRTPLQLAAAMGNLPMVKLFIEVYHCDDSKIAPDGQTALRLAAENGHRHVVDYLPVRRGGGWKRWQTRHEVAMHRARSAVNAIYKFLKFFLWDVEKFFLWSVPKHLVVKPLAKSCKWCWEQRGRFSTWCQHQIKEMPGRAKRFGNRVWKGVKKIPKAVADGAKVTWKFSTTTLPKAVHEAAIKIWQFLTKDLPKMIGEVSKSIWKFLTETLPKVSCKFAKWIWELFTKRLPNMTCKVSKSIWKFLTETLMKAIRKIAIWTWNLLTKRIPEAIVIVSKWIWAGISAVGKIALDLLQKTVSFLHTTFTAIISFFRSLTFRDIWNAFCDVLQVVFVSVPKAMWGWIVKFGETTYKVMEKLFGTLGKCVWWIGYGILFLCLYVPKKIVEILASVGTSIGAGFHEVHVWLNPKV